MICTQIQQISKVCERNATREATDMYTVNTQTLAQGNCTRKRQKKENKTKIEIFYTYIYHKYDNDCMKTNGEHLNDKL